MGGIRIVVIRCRNLLYIKSCKVFEGLSPHAFENPTVSVACVSSTYESALPPCWDCWFQ